MMDATSLKIRLQVQQGSMLRYSFELPASTSTWRAGVTVPTWDVGSKQQNQLVHRLLDAGEARRAEPELERLGRALYVFLLPKEVQQFLSQLDRPLCLDIDRPEVPWELLHDGTTFLGLKQPIGRQLQLSQDIRAEQQTSLDEKIRCLIVSNPTEDLPGAEEEATRLLQFLRARHSERRPIGPSLFARRKADFASIFPQLGQDYTVIHYTGHADYRNGRALLLAQNDRLEADQIAAALRGQPFVFANACGTDYTKRGRGARWFAHVAENIAGAFIRGGARAVVATLWKIPDDSSADFALLFYEELFRGIPVGEALRVAKLRFREQRRDDPTWAAFMLYGDPCWCVLPPEEAQHAEAPVHTVQAEAAAAPPERNGWVSYTGHDVMARARDVTCEYQHGYISTPEVLLALGELEQGITAAVLTRCGKTPAQLSGLLRAEMEQGTAVGEPAGVTERVQRMQQLALQLAQAEGLAEAEERHLLLALLLDGGGDTMRWVEREVSLTVQEMQHTLLALLQEAGVDTATLLQVAAQGPAALANDLPYAAVVQQALQNAVAEARAQGWAVVTSAHLFIALTKIEAGCTQDMLQALGYEPKQVRDGLRAALGTRQGGQGEVSLSTRVARLLQVAQAQTTKDGAKEVDERHVLSVLLTEADGSAVTLLQHHLGLEPAEMADIVAHRRTGTVGHRATPLLDRLGRDLVKEARDGRLNPVIGRKQEMERGLEVLVRKSKNNPVLIGEAGVGKTAIVEGLAQRLAAGDVPANVQGWRIIELPVAALVAGTKYRGEFESRMQKLVEEAEAADDIILFIDELHTLVGAGEASGASLDAGNILKPALARGRLRCIGATTTAEYRRYIEKDAALERRFQPIMVEEPAAAEVLEMLHGARRHYEKHHGVIVHDDALQAAVRLSGQHLPERRWPDKAFDLIDAACARVGLRAAEKRSLAVTPAIVADMVAEWAGIPVGQLTQDEQQRLLGLDETLKQRVVGQDEAITTIAQGIRLARGALRDPQKPMGVFLFLGPSGVGKTELAKTLAQVLFGSDKHLLRLDMSECMERHSISKLIGAPPGYVGYADAEGQLTGWLRRRPYSVVLMDEIEKAHPEVFDLFLQLFDAGRLTDTHGRIADGHNAVFIMTSNLAAALCADPVGFSAHGAADPEARERRLRRVKEELRKTFRTEFLNRIDDMIVFNPLQREHVRRIARRYLRELQERVRDNRGVELTMHPEPLCDLLCREGFSEREGARQLYRVFERLVAIPVNEALLRGGTALQKIGVWVDDQGEVLVAEQERLA